MVSKTLFSSASVEWETPQDLFDRLHAKYQFTLDVCATKENAKCAQYFDTSTDGLKQSWAGERVWCNPPYGREIFDWVARCSAHSFAVMLLPARTDVRWWHDFVIPYGDVEFIKGRLKFGGHKNSAPFPSAVVVFGEP